MKHNMKTRLTLLTSSDPNVNPSARFRAYQFLPFFETKSDFEVVGTVIINSRLRSVALLFELLRLVRLVIRSDVLMIQKARLPKPVLWLLSQLTIVIYDFDDSTFLPSPSWERNKSFKSRKRRLNYSLKRSSIVVAGNQYLADYASQFNRNVFIIPTVVTTNNSLSKNAYKWDVPPQIYKEKESSQDEKAVVIGWIGGGEHIKQLDQVLPALIELKKKYTVEVKVVSDRPWLPEGLAVINKPWRLEDEVSDVQSFDIGLMPLEATDPYLKGKCAFKAIEYMAVGVPAVATSVGANREAIRHSETGFLVSSPEEWEKYLTELLCNPDLRRRMGKAAREWVVQSYSLECVLPQYLQLFRTSR